MPYNMVGSASKQPSSFYLGSYNYTDVPDVQNQQACASCYAFSIAASLSSVYSKTTGQHFTFSPQFIMDCIPVTGKIEEGGSGCWGGFPGEALDFIIDVGSVIPVQLDYPYAGVQGRCDRSVRGVATGMTHYEHPNTTEQIKDAIMNHGAVSVATRVLQVHGAFKKFVPSSSFLPSFPGHLGVGVSCTLEDSTGEFTDHVVILVGWAPCQIAVSVGATISSGDVHHIFTEASHGCWIVQNSWGAKAGYQGLYFVNADPQFDCGIHAYALIPVIQTEVAT
ncbi:hypothetical protein CEUSTIGMA_g7711.t1 [Chlamydomonas eustigma]|uniref:Peptidase C1A papain C-terminal domain-containing protein n=1 Tax=Chlamydomonas eustigma TaxID=1157962 RepID=A0A250XB06_9CHLO|nr:hypothetical protein CEUSTIGMA_g7711.t1 [Chlamydomonas eustigma]|eukprot:GAX80273.1 hypothetical protein CEUSTIGMA_g7711.t1 [Chlamydomonas eustigma]